MKPNIQPQWLTFPILPLALFAQFLAVPASGQLSDYRGELAAWRAQRLEELRAPLGWLSLAGLYWLEEGDNVFGSARGSGLLFPRSAPSRMGNFRLEAGRVRLIMEEGLEASCEGRQQQEQELTPREGRAPVCSWENFTWTVIARGGRLGVRLWDQHHPARSNFDSVPYFAIDTSWQVPARFIPYDPPRTVKIDNVVGMKIDQQVPGQLVFTIGKASFSLDVFDGGPSEFFIIFSDETTGIETYGGGRYLYVARPDQQGLTTIDFNRAHNPPCAFTAYATCLLPPPQNRMPLAVRAGELDYGDH